MPTTPTQRHAENARCRGSNPRSATDKTGLCALREFLPFRKQLLIHRKVILSHSRTRKLLRSFVCASRHLSAPLWIINEIDQFVFECCAVNRIDEHRRITPDLPQRLDIPKHKSTA